MTKSKEKFVVIVVAVVAGSLSLLSVPHAFAVLYNASGELGHYVVTFVPTGPADFVDENSNSNSTGLSDSDTFMGQGNKEGFDYPQGDVLDAANHRLFVEDSSDYRILVFQLDNNNNIATTSASYEFGWTDFTDSQRDTNGGYGSDSPDGLAYDPVNQRLFVADGGDNAVLIYNVSTSTIANGEAPAYTLGSGTRSAGRNGLNDPESLAYDATTDRLFVDDARNNRVLVFDVDPMSVTSGENAENVLGQSGYSTTTATTTQSSISSNDGGLAFDPVNERLFTADDSNDRVLVFNVATSTITDNENASHILGQSSYFSVVRPSQTPNQMYPDGLGYDPVTERLFVADEDDRVLVFNVATSTIMDDEDAEHVLGEPDFGSDNCDSTATSTVLCFPQGDMAYDPTSGNLFVTDSDDLRVLQFDVATSTIFDGEAATNELGQYQLIDSPGAPSFTSSTEGNGFLYGGNTPNHIGLEAPQDAVIDTVNHRLFVADQANRVVVFQLDNNNHIANPSATYVLGQTGFDADDFTPGQSGIDNPQGLAYDPVNSRLFIADSGNRVLVFDVATSTIMNDELAEHVLGHSDYVTLTSGATQSSMSGDEQLAYDSVSSRLFVADSNNDRVLVFNVATSTITDDEDAENIIGQSEIGYDYGIAYDASSSRLFISDAGSNRVLVFNAATSTIANGENAENVLGQSDYASSTEVIGQAGIAGGAALAYDPVSQILYVEDGNNRIVSFAAGTSTIINGENAENVLGQSDYISSGGTTTQTGFNLGGGLDVDPVDNQLFLTDEGNNRIMDFSLVSISTPPLAAGNVSTSYSQTVETTSTQGTVTFALASGALPAGLSLSTSTGMISGTPTSGGTSQFAIQAADSFSTGAFFDQSNFSIDISGGGSGGGGGGSGGGGGGGNSGASPLTGVGTASYDIAINGNATTTETTNVSLLLYGTAAYTMEISNNPNFVGVTWQPYTTVLPWTLVNALGPETVYVKYRAANDMLLGAAQVNIIFAAKGTASTTTTMIGGGASEPLQLVTEIHSLALQMFLSANHGRTLLVGSHGQDVWALQVYLIANNALHATGPAGNKLTVPTGYFGTLTKNALIEYQMEAGISPANGVLSPKTHAYLKNLTEGN